VESVVTLCVCICFSADEAERLCICHCLHDCGLLIYIYIYICIIKYINYIFLYFTGVYTYIISTSMYAECYSTVVQVINTCLNVQVTFCIFCQIFVYYCINIRIFGIVKFWEECRVCCCFRATLPVGDSTNSTSHDHQCDIHRGINYFSHISGNHPAQHAYCLCMELGGGE